MQDLDHSFHSPEYELTISHGDPIQVPGSFKKICFIFMEPTIFHESGLMYFGAHYLS